MTICLFARLVGSVLLLGVEPATGAQSPPPLSLHQHRNPNLRYEALEGTYEVYENRAAGSGRKIGLHFIVIPAKSPNPKPDPIFVLAGGPGTLAGKIFRIGHLGHVTEEDIDDVLTALGQALEKLGYRGGKPA